MKKPFGYEEARVHGEFRPLPSDGYVCVIKQVREQTSRSGKPMIVIALDIFEGDYKGYYEQSYRADTRQEKKWGCNVYQLTETDEGKCSAGFKTFITSVEKSNPGFATVWGDGFCAAFKGKLVGGLFGREQYQKNNGDLAWSTKCIAFRSVDTIRNGEFTVPEDKPFTSRRGDAYDTGYSAPAMMAVQVDESLPF